MIPGVRALTAYVASALVSGRPNSSVFDYELGGYRMISGTVSKGNINIFDHTDSCHFTGSGNGMHYSLYHYGEGAHITLDIKGKSFMGYDYGSGSHFNGTVSGKSVMLYDYGEGRYFNFST